MSFMDTMKDFRSDGKIGGKQPSAFSKKNPLQISTSMSFLVGLQLHLFLCCDFVDLLNLN